MSKSQLDKSKAANPAFRLDLYKLAHLEAKTLLGCGWKASEISIDEIYERLLKEELDGIESQGIPSPKEFAAYEKHCRAQGIKPYRF